MKLGHSVSSYTYIFTPEDLFWSDNTTSELAKRKVTDCLFTYISAILNIASMVSVQACSSTIQQSWNNDSHHIITSQDQKSDN